MQKTNRLFRRTAHSSSRGGFTLVELLVVIGIIAILAGVALGPITAGIKKGQQSSGVQNARSLALADFQYANDNSQSYASGTDASVIAQALLTGGYISDPGIFVLSNSSQTKYSGSGGITTSNVSWDFGCQTAAASDGLNANTPDEAPLLVSTSMATYTIPAGANTAVTLTGLDSAAPFGLLGVAMCQKSNSAKFILAVPPVAATVVQLADTSWPGYTMTMALGGK